MKPKHITFIIAIILIALGLGACSGSATTATSWPGLTVDDQFAYLAYQTQVHAINLENGREEWRFPDEPDNNVTFYADPALSEDGQVIIGGYDYVLYSLEGETGRMTGGNWPFTEAAGRYIAGPLVVRENVFAPAADDNMYAVDLEGNLQWTYSADGESWSQPIADSNCECIYVTSTEHTVAAVDPTNGSQIWQSPTLGGSVVGTPAISEDGTLFVGSFGSKLFALNADDGSIIWEFPTQGWVWSGPALHNGILYFGDLAGYFYAVEASNGDQLWQLTPEQLELDPGKGQIVATPLVFEDNIYVVTNTGSLIKIDFSGDIIDSENVDPENNRGQIYTSPKTSQGLILIAPTQIDEILVAYNQDLNEEWSFTP